MFVKMLVGRMAGSIADLPLHAAQAGLVSGTHVRATEDELFQLGIMPAPEMQSPAETFPAGYRAERDEEGAGYMVFGPDNSLISGNDLLPSLAAARSFATDYATVDTAAEDKGSVLIPVDWTDLPYQEQRAIAAQIAPGTRSKEAIAEVIDAELARRAAG